MKIKFSVNKPVIHKNLHDWQLWDLRQEFEKIMAHQHLVEQVAISYVDPCVLAKYRINNI